MSHDDYEFVAPRVNWLDALGLLLSLMLLVGVLSLGGPQP